MNDCSSHPDCVYSDCIRSCEGAIKGSVALDSVQSTETKCLCL